MRMLIVDDEPMLTALINKVLSREGWLVTTAHSLCEAKALTGTFDVIVADLRLPNGDGRHLRELYPGTPFVTISGAHGESPDLAKPFSPSQLKGAVYAAVPTMDRRRMPR